jgi:hypothetical protein
LVKLHLEERGAICSREEEAIPAVLPHTRLIEQGFVAALIPAGAPVTSAMKTNERQEEASTTARCTFANLPLSKDDSSSVICTINTVVTIVCLLLQEGDTPAMVTPEMVHITPAPESSFLIPPPPSSSSSCTASSTPTLAQNEIIEKVENVSDLDSHEKRKPPCIVYVSHGPSATFCNVSLAEVIKNLGTIIVPPLLYSRYAGTPRELRFRLSA